MKLKREHDKLERQITKLEDKKDKFIEKIDSKLENLTDKQFKIGLRMSHMEKLKRINCLHKKEYGRREWANCRDDASFSTYVACKKCDETLWDECYGPRGGYG